MTSHLKASTNDFLVKTLGVLLLYIEEAIPSFLTKKSLWFNTLLYLATKSYVDLVQHMAG